MAPTALLMLAAAAYEQAQTLADLLDKQPLAGFLGLTITAVVTLFGLLMWQISQHQKTLREVVTLTATFAKQWDRHLDLEQRMIESDEHEHPRPPPYPSLPQEHP